MQATTSNITTVKLAPYSFINAHDYLFETESTGLVEQYTNFFNEALNTKSISQLKNVQEKHSSVSS